MSKSIWATGIALGTLGLAGYFSVHNMSPLVTTTSTASTPSPAITQAIETLETKSSSVDVSALSSDTLTADQKALLAHPKVQAYLKREQEKNTLKQYFEQPTGHNPESIYNLIEKIESEGRLLGFEALNLKLAWLEINTPDEGAFKAASQKLLNTYKQRAAQAAENYAPEKIAGYSEYKKMETEIINEVMAMDSFPNGHSQQSYLRERLLKARILAYGSE